MDVHHAAGAVGGDYHEAVVFIGFILGGRVLADRCAQYWRPVPTADQVGLLKSHGEASFSFVLVMRLALRVSRPVNQNLEIIRNRGCYFDAYLRGVGVSTII